MNLQMPPEWAAHERTWMAFPPGNGTFDEEGSETLARARTAWSAVASAVADSEPVTMVVRDEDAPAARAALGDRVELLVAALDDAWMRDMGPTFVTAGSGIVAVDWVFNGWGAQDWSVWELDAKIAAAVAAAAAVPVVASSLTNEGGGIHVDGQGTVLLTETVQLDPGRNPGWTKEQVEAEVHARLGTTTAIWLPRGLTKDYDEFGTRGHVDIVAAFSEPGVVLVHDQTDPTHPDNAVSAEVIDILSSATDARGERLRIVRVPAPTVLEVGGELVDYSYINHYVINGAVILCAFDDPNDVVAQRILESAYPGRRVVLVDARDIFEFGGGIHCITQQQPSAL